jgi:hypothetical protein
MTILAIFVQNATDMSELQIILTVSSELTIQVFRYRD